MGPIGALQTQARNLVDRLRDAARSDQSFINIK